jgi:hypothetical protein
MDDQQIAAWIAKWQKSGGAERANYQLFLTELCDVLGVPHPDPTVAEEPQNAYVFEKNVIFNNGDGTTSTKRVDLYRRGCFVCETKQGVEAEDDAQLLSTKSQEARKQRKAGHGKRGTAAFDDTMLRAKGQAEQYARNLPANEGRPPFLMVIDVGHTIELHAEFSQTGGVYTPFPDPVTYRIRLADLADEKVREQLALVWTDPHALDPAKRAAKVTREIAGKLAELAKSLEGSQHNPQDVAQFLMRCLFTMFAEDVGLLDRDSFKELLKKITDPAGFVPTMEELWRSMNIGGFSVSLNRAVKRFNGGLFADSRAIPLTRDQLNLLIEAAEKSWNDVEPAIFGTLLERALDPVERHKLGAHYTPRAYVERLVIPTVVEPLREEWDASRTAAVTLAKQGDTAGAVKELERFHDRLCEVKVLDPACGSGNFLYVTLEHLKRIEGEVFTQMEAIADRQTMIAWQQTTEGKHTVDPHQLLGIEINPRAAAIAELVLWIGYLQWHYRTRGKVSSPEPIIKDFKNIECRDAVLSWSSTQIVLDENNKPVTRWDGRTTKPHPVTGEEVPDETARIPIYTYLNPKKAEWPKAEFVVGNPPFIGGWMIRQANGDGYVESLWSVYDLPEKADYVMYWWDRAAELTRTNEISRFGFITTNSIRQVFQRRVLERHIQAKESPLCIYFAIPDHPWVDSESAAAVRIAMTVAGTNVLTLPVIGEVIDEDIPEALVAFQNVQSINHQLHSSVNLDSAESLLANSGLSCPGVQLYGSGFIVDEPTSLKLSKQSKKGANVIRKYMNGRDFMQSPRGVYVIDFFGLDKEQSQNANPSAFQHLIDYVKPERDQNRRPAIRNTWWRFGWERPVWRSASAGLDRFIATPETSKHRVFAFLDQSTLPDNMITGIALCDAYFLGVLSSHIHVRWSLGAGGTLEDRPRYTKTVCFEPFPFPDASEAQKAKIRELGEQLDAHRKRQQELHPTLTMTGMYNVLEKLRAGDTLTAKEKTIHEQGLVSVLKQIHDDLDAAVADAYGWPVDLSDEEILERLVALNHERAEEERRGIIRYLRPDYQNPKGQNPQGQTQKHIAVAEYIDEGDEETKKPPAPKSKSPKKPPKKLPWPKALSEQAAAVQSVLVAINGPASEDDVAKRFTRANKDRVAELLDTLTSLGKARTLEDGRFLAV